MKVYTGKRKTSIARAVVKKGSGRVFVNGMAIDEIYPSYLRLRAMEPLLLVKDKVKNIDIHVRVRGGGIVGQADAVRMAIGKALADNISGIRDLLESYDRSLLVADTRRKETRKPLTHGKARAKRQTSYR